LSFWRCPHSRAFRARSPPRTCSPAQRGLRASGGDRHWRPWDGVSHARVTSPGTALRRRKQRCKSGPLPGAWETPSHGLNAEALKRSNERRSAALGTAVIRAARITR
jgi:hypothetical protein